MKMSSDMVRQRLCAAVDTLDGAVLIERYEQLGGWVGGFLADFFTSSIFPSATPPHSISQSLALPCDVPRQIRQAV